MGRIEEIQKINDEASQKAYHCKREIESDSSIVFEMKCYNEDEYKMFRDVFEKILGPEVMKTHIKFTWLSFTEGTHEEN